ncbi:hypothetical protein LCGC14_1818290 [marine sediment metagenome]|uniref:Coenzyme PQQ synthesis protein D (PqqD) n=1 Tax=marine sediment metagenome TaxID=412755 RepID=A0A0F9IZG2_9ZZZZ
MSFAKYVKVRNEKFGAVLFDTLREKVYVTNETGKDILDLMAQELDPAVIAQRLADSYGEEASEILPQIAEFVEQLQSAGMLAGAEEAKA